MARAEPAPRGPSVGDRAQLGEQVGRVIGLAELFGQRYVDLFIEPSGPVQRVPEEQVALLHDPFVELAGGRAVPAPRFIARLIAAQLDALVTREGVLSATNFRLTPLPHQVLAVDFVLNQLHPRCLIADEVGLGKTIEAAMVFEELKLRRQVRRVLVVVPSGLRSQWREELERKFGEAFVVYDREMLSALRQMHGQEANLWQKHDQVITSLDFVKPLRTSPTLSPAVRAQREAHNAETFEAARGAGWDMIIVDEAHKLSKHADGTETARFALGEGLAQVAPVFLALTATPHQGDAGRFLHLLQLVDPLGYSTPADLSPERVAQVTWRTRKRAAVDTNGKLIFKQRITDIFPVDRSGPGHALERELYDAVSDYVRDHYNQALGRNDRAFGFLMILFQRLVTSSSRAILDALEKRLNRLRTLEGRLRPGELDEEETEELDGQAALDALLDVGVVDQAGLAEELGLLQGLVDLARRAVQAEQDAKMLALLEIIDQVCRREGDPRTKFLIFTEFVATQNAVCELLQGIGYAVERINGGMDEAARLAARVAFAGESQFLVSTDAGGEGINLQFCHVMVNYDLPWNPMRIEQRIGRLDRIGQEHNVLVLNLVIQDTVEARVRSLLESKLDLIRQQFGEDRLADVLSTLQEEFSFDRLYADAIARLEAQAVDLEAVAQAIYERALQVLQEEDLLLPQAQAHWQAYQDKLVADSQERIHALLESYLAAIGARLEEYGRRSGVYYFDLPGPRAGAAHWGSVVFERERAVADDSLTYLHINHPLVRELLAELNQPGPAQAARLRVRLPGVSPTTGVWALYLFACENGHDVCRREVFSVFIDADGTAQPRAGRQLLDVRPDQVEEARSKPPDWDVTRLRAEAEHQAELQARERFLAEQFALNERLARERERLEQYYAQAESAARAIAIENIRQSKLRELVEQRRTQLDELAARGTLIPKLTLLQAAAVEVQGEA